MSRLAFISLLVLGTAREAFEGSRELFDLFLGRFSHALHQSMFGQLVPADVRRSQLLPWLCENAVLLSMILP